MNTASNAAGPRSASSSEIVLAERGPRMALPAVQRVHVIVAQGEDDADGRRIGVKVIEEGVMLSDEP